MKYYISIIIAPLYLWGQKSSKNNKCSILDYSFVFIYRQESLCGEQQGGADSACQECHAYRRRPRSSQASPQ